MQGIKTQGTPLPRLPLRHGYNIVGRVRDLAHRREWTDDPAKQASADNALVAIHEILKGEGLD